MRTLLIIGTDTGVGKTWVGRALGHALKVDLARSLGAVALVAGVDRAGAFNHTLLTRSALESRRGDPAAAAAETHPILPWILESAG